MDSLPRFQVLAGLSDSIMDGVRSKIYEDFGQDVLDAIINETMTQEINIPTLMFHDKADDVTPIEDSRAIARAWSSASLIETEGLNHRGALKSKEIHTQIIRFLKD
jgi:pimeloyl-ACP methyl ester carboxylesterase